jgi:hypothetical protein
LIDFWDLYSIWQRIITNLQRSKLFIPYCRKQFFYEKIQPVCRSTFQRSGNPKFEVSWKPQWCRWGYHKNSPWYLNIKILMPFLHLPVQSGSDEILRKMNQVPEENNILKWSICCSDMAFSSDFNRWISKRNGNRFWRHFGFYKKIEIFSDLFVLSTVHGLTLQWQKWKIKFLRMLKQSNCCGREISNNSLILTSCLSERISRFWWLNKGVIHDSLLAKVSIIRP